MTGRAPGAGEELLPAQGLGIVEAAPGGNGEGGDVEDDVVEDLLGQLGVVGQPVGLGLAVRWTRAGSRGW